VNRAPIVIAATAAGLGLVLSFRTHSPSVAKVSTAEAPGSTTTTRPAAGPSTVPTTSASARSATGDDVQYRYGDIELKVTEQGTRITEVQVVQNDGVDPHSDEINSQAVPILGSQTMSAQSANIDGVTGATFTSEAYVQSLQSALDQLSP
jgi:uncharacterized protein with FMN-binding domain